MFTRAITLFEAKFEFKMYIKKGKIHKYIPKFVGFFPLATSTTSFFY